MGFKISKKKKPTNLKEKNLNTQFKISTKISLRYYNLLRTHFPKISHTWVQVRICWGVQKANPIGMPMIRINFVLFSLHLNIDLKNLLGPPHRGYNSSKIKIPNIEIGVFHQEVSQVTELNIQIKTKEHLVRGQLKVDPYL